jgi:hypothetical protein
MSQFAGEQKFAEISEAFALFKKAHSANWLYVQEQMPAKILNYFLIKDVSLEAFDRWENDKGRDWAQRIKDALTNQAMFDAIVRRMRNEILEIASKNVA